MIVKWFKPFKHPVSKSSTSRHATKSLHLLRTLTTTSLFPIRALYVPHEAQRMLFLLSSTQIAVSRPSYLCQTHFLHTTNGLELAFLSVRAERVTVPRRSSTQSALKGTAPTNAGHLWTHILLYPLLRNERSIFDRANLLSEP